MRSFIKIFGTVVVIILILPFCAIQRVDTTPYFETDYYSQTKLRFDSISDQLFIAKGEVQVGFARLSITPQFGAENDKPELGIFREIPMAGFGSRKGKYSEGIHDSIFVKAVAIKVEDQLLILLGSDMLIIPPVLTESVCQIVNETMGLKRDQIFFSATHTHSSLGAWSEGYVGKEFAGEANPNVVKWLSQQFSLAIENAVKDLKTGKIGSGNFEASGLINNRLAGEQGEKNSEFTFIMAEQFEGRKAILGSFGAHSTTLGGGNMLISADYPGYWQRKLENESADMAVFFAGSVGSHSPQSQGEGFEKSRYIGEALADSVLKYSSNIELTDSIGLSYISLKMNLPEFHIRVSDDLRLSPGIGGKLFPDVGEVYVQVARIGGLIWATSPSDFSGEMAIDFKNAMNNKGYNSMVTSFNGAYVGYIIPEKYYHLKEYESRLMSWFGPTMGPYNEEMMRRMMEELTDL